MAFDMGGPRRKGAHFAHPGPRGLGRPGYFEGDLTTVHSLLVEGKIEAHVDGRMPLEKAAEALGVLALGKASGKLVLVPGSAE